LFGAGVVRIAIELVGGPREVAPEHTIVVPLWSEAAAEFRVDFTGVDATQPAVAVYAFLSHDPTNGIRTYVFSRIE
jgi:hypothetical protein